MAEYNLTGDLTALKAIFINKQDQKMQRFFISLITGMLMLCQYSYAQNPGARPVSTPSASIASSLQRVVKNLVLKHLLSLAADVNAADNARALALYEVDALKKWMTAKEGTVSDPQQKGDLLYGLQLIEEFKANPGTFRPATPAPLPAGPPIGG